VAYALDRDDIRDAFIADLENRYLLDDLAAAPRRAAE
jgi:hypothetical protein